MKISLQLLGLIACIYMSTVSAHFPFARGNSTDRFSGLRGPPRPGRGAGRGRGAPPGIDFETIICGAQDDIEAACVVGRAGSKDGAWVCRTVNDRVSGEPREPFTACIDHEQSIGNDADQCGCCPNTGCPKTCDCPCEKNLFNGTR